MNVAADPTVVAAEVTYRYERDRVGAVRTRPVRARGARTRGARAHHELLDRVRTVLRHA